MIPSQVEVSAVTSSQDAIDYSPENSIDLDLTTKAKAGSDDQGFIWFKLSFSEVNCVQVIRWRKFPTDYWLKWTCTDQGCPICEGDGCTHQHLETIEAEVTIEGPHNTDSLLSVTNCHYGDRVLIKGRPKEVDTYLSVRELIVTHGKRS